MALSYSRRDIVVAACSVGLVVLAQPGIAAPMSFKVDLNGAQQVPPVQTGATGTADLTYDPATRVLTWDVNHSGLSGPATMAHFHGPATQGNNAPPVIWLSEKGAAVSNPIKGQATLTPEQAQQMTAGEWLYQCSHPGQPRRRDPRPGDTAQGLTRTQRNHDIQRSREVLEPPHAAGPLSSISANPAMPS